MIQAEYLGSFPSVRACPDLGKPEYAFVGRSNVGKSSLINYLCHRKDLARVSNQPGKTQTINLYTVDDTWVLADLPGYGYAKVSQKQRAGWEGMIGDYLRQRKSLMCVFVLLDLRHSLQKIDREFINSLGADGVPFALVYTKADKVVQGQRNDHRDRIESELLEEWESLPERFETSATGRLGGERLLEYINTLNARALSR